SVVSVKVFGCAPGAADATVTTLLRPVVPPQVALQLMHTSPGTWSSVDLGAVHARVLAASDGSWTSISRNRWSEPMADLPRHVPSGYGAAWDESVTSFEALGAKFSASARLAAIKNGNPVGACYTSSPPVSSCVLSEHDRVHLAEVIYRWVSSALSHWRRAF